MSFTHSTVLLSWCMPFGFAKNIQMCGINIIEEDHTTSRVSHRLHQQTLTSSKIKSEPGQGCSINIL